MIKKKISIMIERLEESFKESRKFASGLDNGIIKAHTPKIAFENYNTYKKLLTEKRLQLIMIIKTKKPKSIRELAVLTKRDFKNIYEDIKILKNVGLVELKKSKSGIIPRVIYDEIDINIKIPIEAVSNY